MSRRAAGRLAGAAGFTLVEMLAVIMILGLLVGMVLPVAGHLDDKTRRQQTEAVFEQVRQAILGARGAVDGRGQPVIGGYVGQLGHLPPLYVYEWNPGLMAWTHPDADGDGMPDRTADLAARAVGDGCAQPAGLWGLQLARMADGAGGFKRGLLAEAGSDAWAGPYLQLPRDPMPDDQVYEYVASSGTAAEVDNNRCFRLREGQGRVCDGWGRAFIIYVADRDGDGSPDLDGAGHPLNLAFVSAGADGRYAADDPADEKLAGNADNLVFTIVPGEWDESARRIEQTMALLEDLRRAIVGQEALNTGGEIMRSGFIADIGSPEPLTGSVVVDDGRAYRCIATHVADSANRPVAAGNACWLKLSDDAAGDWPLAWQWRAAESYFAATPGLLLAAADYVSHGGCSYRCIQSHKATAAREPGLGADWTSCWRLDNSLGGPAWSAGAQYFDYQAGAALIPAWTYYPTCQMGAGWRGPYLSRRGGLPLADAWGHAVQIELDARRNLSLRSCGPDGPAGTAADDLVVNIARSAYEIPLQVNVADCAGASKHAAVTVAEASDVVDVYLPHNGRLCLRRAWAGAAGTGPEATTPFVFDDGVAGGASLAPVVPALWDRGTAATADDVPAPVRSETAATPDVTPPAAGSYARCYLPIGRRCLVYRDDAFASASGNFASPSPVMDANLPGYSQSGGLPGRPGYQKACQLHPGTDAQVRLGP